MTFSLCCWRFAFGARVIETLLKLSINVTRQLFLFFNSRCWDMKAVWHRELSFSSDPRSEASEYYFSYIQRYLMTAVCSTSEWFILRSLPSSPESNDSSHSLHAFTSPMFISFLAPSFASCHSMIFLFFFMLYWIIICFALLFRELVEGWAGSYVRFRSFSCFQFFLKSSIINHSSAASK